MSDFLRVAVLVLRHDALLESGRWHLSAIIQPCDWAKQPQLKGSFIEVLLSEGTGSTWDTYPYECAKGLVGGGNISEQLGPLCAGQCPEGQLCSRTATTQPEACPPSFYCEKGSVEPILCPAGTWSDRANLTSAGDCTECARGEYCTEARTSPAPLSSAASLGPQGAQCECTEIRIIAQH